MGTIAPTSVNDGLGFAVREPCIVCHLRSTMRRHAVPDGGHQRDRTVCPVKYFTKKKNENFAPIS